MSLIHPNPNVHMSENKVDIGASITRIPSFVNIDVAPTAEVSLVLYKDVLPFETSSEFFK